MFIEVGMDGGLNVNRGKLWIFILMSFVLAWGLGGLIQWLTNVSGLVYIGMVSVFFLGFIWLFYHFVYVKKVENLSSPTFTLVEGLTHETYYQTITDAEQRIHKLRDLSNRIPNEEIAMMVEAICRISQKILKKVTKDPKKIRLIQRYFDYYLEATIKIIEQYVLLLETGLDSKDIEETKREVESVLLQIGQTFENHLIRVVENDVFDLNAELRTLGDLMKQDR